MSGFTPEQTRWKCETFANKKTTDIQAHLAIKWSASDVRATFSLVFWNNTSFDIVFLESNLSFAPLDF